MIATKHKHKITAPLNK